MSEFIGNSEHGSWKETFKKQTDSGSYWKKLHGEDFDRQKFLMMSDAHYICYKSQSDILKTLAKKLKQSGVDNSVIDEIIKLENELWEGPNSVNECTMAFNLKK